MQRSYVALLVAASLCSWMGMNAALSAEPSPPPITAFANLPAMSQPVLSPNGQQLAWIDNSGSRQAVEIIDLLKNARLLRLESEAELKVRRIQWADDEILLIVNAITQSAPLPNGNTSGPIEWERTKALNVHTRKSQILLLGKAGFGISNHATMLAPRTARPKKVVMSNWQFSNTNYRQETGSRLAGGRKDSGWTYDLIEVDTMTAAERRLAEGTPFTTEWLVDSAGEPFARSEWDPERKRFAIVHRRGQAWREIYSLESADRPTLAMAAEDGSAVLMFGRLGRPTLALWRVPVDGSAPQVMFENPQYDVTSLQLDAHTFQLQAAWLGGPSPALHWFDETAQKRSEALRKTFGGSYAQVIGRSADNNRVLVDVASHSKPSTFYLIDYKRGAADIVGEEYPSLANVTLSEVQTIAYRARDGYEIPAYLTLPPGREAKQLALVALPHGGPESHDSPDFDWLAQFLASRGYAILQPQFRGSTGLGSAHAKAGERQWGRIMQDDVTDGVKAMIERGVADPRRICIVGASYGGYSALAGAAFTPELYACAASINGVSDLPMILGYQKLTYGAESNALNDWIAHIGDANDPEVIAKSPARAVNDVRAPILLLHGSNDSVVPVVQAHVMLKALQAKGKPVKFVELPAEDHWLSSSESRLRVLTELETFLWTYLGQQGGGG
jgi:dipeptidyl aminopeptidase/acylaminoacyl peptidase